MDTTILKNKTREVEDFIKRANRKLGELRMLQSKFYTVSMPKFRGDILTKLSEKSFNFWNNSTDAIYDNL